MKIFILKIVCAYSTLLGGFNVETGIKVFKDAGQCLRNVDLQVDIYKDKCGSGLLVKCEEKQLIEGVK